MVKAFSPHRSPAPVALDQLIEGDAALELRRFPSASVHLTVTSPPYGNLRVYGGHPCDLRPIIAHLYRVTAPGGVVVWVVADAHGDAKSDRPGEGDDAFDQVRLFREAGFVRHDTMIAEWPNKMPRQKYRYEQVFDYMFVFCKGPRPRVARIARVPCENAGATVTARVGHADDQVGPYRDRGGPRRRLTVGADKPAGNVRRYSTGFYQTSRDPITWDHPAPFPEALARDHILSWSDPGDVVLDPLCGSGTTLKMAALEGRRFVGIEVCPQYADIARRRTDLYRKPWADAAAVLASVPPPAPKPPKPPKVKPPKPEFVWADDEPTADLVAFAALAGRTTDAVRMLIGRKRLPARKSGRAWVLPVRAAALIRPPQKRRWGSTATAGAGR